MPQLDPTWFASQLFWLVICFTVLYLLLSKLVLPPLQNVIAARKGAIDADLVAAQEFKSLAELAKQDYAKTLLESREIAQNLINEAEIANKEDAKLAMKALDTQVAAQLANSSKSINAKKQEMLSALVSETAEFSALIAEKLTTHAPSEDMVKRALQTLN